MVFVPFPLRCGGPAQLRKGRFNEELRGTLPPVGFSSGIRDRKTGRHSRRLLEVAANQCPSVARHDIVPVRAAERPRVGGIQTQGQHLCRRRDRDPDLSNPDARLRRMALHDPATFLAPLQPACAGELAANGAAPIRKDLGLARRGIGLRLASFSRVGNSDGWSDGSHDGWNLVGSSALSLRECLKDKGPAFQPHRDSNAPCSSYAKVYSRRYRCPITGMAAHLVSGGLSWFHFKL